MTDTAPTTAELEAEWEAAKSEVTEGIASLIVQDRLPKFQLEFPEVKRAYDAWHALDTTKAA